jgi:hypothetical protein
MLVSKLDVPEVRTYSQFMVSLGTFAKLRKAAISFVMSVRRSVCMEQLGCHRTDFHEILYLKIFRKSIEKIQVSLKSDNL